MRVASLSTRGDASRLQTLLVKYEKWDEDRTKGEEHVTWWSKKNVMMMNQIFIPREARDSR